MAKLELDPIGSLENQTSAVQLLNENFDRIETAFDNTVSRDGSTPNQLMASLDANSQRITNVAPPQAGTDAARWVDITTSYILQGIAIPSLVGNNGKLITNDGTALIWLDPLSIPGLGDMKSTNNLSELTNVPAARTNLGLGTMATEDAINYAALNEDVNRTGTTVFSNATAFGGVNDHRLTVIPAVLTPESLGFRCIPSETKDVDYTFVLNDSGRSKLHTSVTAHTYTIPTEASVPYPIGTVIVVDVVGAGSVVLARAGGVTLRQVGSATDANISIAQWGQAVLRKLSSNSWVCSGVNLS